MTRIQYNLDEVMVIKSTIPVGFTAVADFSVCH